MHEAASHSPADTREPKRPTPVLSLFMVTQSLQGRLESGGRPVVGLTQDWEWV